MRIIVERTIDKLFEMCDSKYYEDDLTSHSSVTQLYQCIWTNVSRDLKSTIGVKSRKGHLMMDLLDLSKPLT